MFRQVCNSPSSNAAARRQASAARIVPREWLEKALLVSLLCLSWIQRPALAQQPLRATTVIGLPVPQFGPDGQLIVRPNVSGGPVPWNPTPAPEAASAANQAGGGYRLPVSPASTALGQPPIPSPEILPPANPGSSGELLPPQQQQFLQGMLEEEMGLPGEYEDGYVWEGFFSLFYHRQTSPSGEAGLGRERVAMAPFEIDITQPFGNFTWRTEAVYNLSKPDRSEYFWSRPGRGPALIERAVDYQDFKFHLEFGSGAFSASTDIPIRILDPEINGNNAGVSDIVQTNKLMLINGSRWQMTQLLRTTFSSGNARKGLGSGHVAMEPGMLFRYKWSDITYMHADLKMSIPLGGTPEFSAPVLKYGIGMSTIFYEDDTFAVMPTVEFINYWFLDGLYTQFPAGPPVDVIGDGAFNIAVGSRIAIDTGGDLGIVEFGINGVNAVGSNGWYERAVRFDLRFVF